MNLLLPTCHRLTLCFWQDTPGLSGITNEFYPKESTDQIIVLDGSLGPSYHSYHLQVLHVRSLCGQQLLGDEVGLICWIPLHGRQDRDKIQSSVGEVCPQTALFRTCNLGPLLF